MCGQVISKVTKKRDEIKKYLNNMAFLSLFTIAIPFKRRFLRRLHPSSQLVGETHFFGSQIEIKIVSTTIKNFDLFLFGRVNINPSIPSPRINKNKKIILLQSFTARLVKDEQSSQGHISRIRYHQFASSED